jgi:hypothetical protein
MSIRDRVAACLNAHRGITFCADCLAREVAAVNIKTVYEAMRYLTGHRIGPHLGFARSSSGKCQSCGNNRIVVYAIAGQSTGDILG